MTLNELKNILDTLGINVAYSHFVKETSTPYLVYYVDGTDNMLADNKVFYKNVGVTIELYTDKKDVALEERLEELLNQNELPYEIVSETYIDSEEVYEIVYQISL